MSPFIDWLFNGPLNGKKSYTAAVIAALLAANALLGFLPSPFVELFLYLGSALGIVGLRHAIDKLKSASSSQDTIPMPPPPLAG